jgi:hypothetical protein
MQIRNENKAEAVGKGNICDMNKGALLSHCLQNYNVHGRSIINILKY